MLYQTLNSESSISKFKKLDFRGYCRMCEMIKDHKYKAHTKGGFDENDNRDVTPVKVNLMCSDCETADAFIYSEAGLLRMLNEQ